MKSQGFFSRLTSLWRGFWTSNLRNAEASNPHYVYESALQKRRVHFQQLKKSTSRLILLRNRTHARIQTNEETLQLLEASINKSAIADNDSKAIALIRKKQTIIEQNERLEMDRMRLEDQISRAKEGIEEGRNSIDALERERDEMMARKNYATNRLELQEIFDATEETLRLSNPALEHVRDSLTQLEIQAELGEDPQLSATPAISATQLREEAALEKAEQELENRKRILSKRLLQPSNSTIPASDNSVTESLRVGV